jgi:hypothetical protein
MPFIESFTGGTEYEKNNAMYLIQEQGICIELCVNQALIQV